MRCREARALLSARLDDELRDVDAAQLERHLDGCTSCRAEGEQYESLRARMRVSEPIAVDLVPALQAELAGWPSPALATLDPSRRSPSRRSGALVAVAAVAAAVVVAVVLVAQDPTAIDVATSRSATAPSLRAPDGASLLLAWTTSGLPDRAADRTRALVGVVGVSEVRGDALSLTDEHDADGAGSLSLPTGAAIPIDALAIDAASYARDVPGPAARVIRELPRDGALLGSTSARLRGIGGGGSLTFGSTTVRVAGVVPDSVVGAAEVVVRADGPLAIRTPRFLLVAYHGDRSEMESAITTALHRPVRFRAPGETPYLRHGDSVLPEALVKIRFGEFWYRVDSGGRVTIDPRWVARNIVTIDVPGVGRLRCHRLVAATLRRVLTAAGAHTTTSAVGFDPEMISRDLRLSRHTWGIGVTLPTAPGARSSTIARLAASGFRWGGLWLNPSPDYFEWVGRTAP
jgi:Putative zinc-finger